MSTHSPTTSPAPRSTVALRRLAVVALLIALAPALAACEAPCDNNPNTERHSCSADRRVPR